MAPRKLRPESFGIKPTQRLVRDLFTYSPYSGLLFWKKGPRKGYPAGSRAHGYLQAYVDGVNYYVHRLAWLWMTGDWPDGVIDHIDGNRKNNSFANLRPATHAENMRNQPIRRRNKHGHTGIRFDPKVNLWHARLMLNYKEFHLGYFKTMEAAVEARERAEVEHFGEFRRQKVASVKRKVAA